MQIMRVGQADNRGCEIDEETTMPIDGMANWIIANDAPVRAVFGENVSRLREIKKKYDPYNMFGKWHNFDMLVQER